MSKSGRSRTGRRCGGRRCRRRPGMRGKPTASCDSGAHQRAVGNAGQMIGRRGRTCRNPGVEIGQQGAQHRARSQRAARLRANPRAVPGDNMREACKGVVAHPVDAAEIMPGAVGLHHRGGLGPVFVGRISLKDFRAAAAFGTSTQPGVGLPGDRIGQHLVGEGELVFRRPSPDMLTMRAVRLRKPIVRERAAAACLPVENAIEHLRRARGCALRLVEAELHEVMHDAARLRRAEGVDRLCFADERIGRALVVGLRIAQECCGITDRRKAEPDHDRVLRHVGELVKRRRPK